MRNIAHICLWWRETEIHLDITAEDGTGTDEALILEALTRALTEAKEILDANPRPAPIVSVH